MSGLDRRSFLKSVAAAAGGGALLQPAGVQARTAAPVWQKTVCPLCSVGCGLLVQIDNGRAIALKGDVAAPVGRGQACAKGYHALQALYARDRITRARIRRNGVLADASLEEALDLVARRLRDTVAKHGADAVAWYGPAQGAAADAELAAALFGSAIGTRYLDAETRLDGGSGTAALLSTFGINAPVGCYDDIEQADTFIVWNQNLAETHPVLFSRILARRRTNPAVRIIELGTRTTRTSYAADRSILFAPQTELLLANAICHELVQRRLVRRDFVDRHVAFRAGATGTALSRDALLDSDDGAERSWSDFVRLVAAATADEAQRTTGVGSAEIGWLASLYGDRSRRVMSIWGDVIGRQPRGTWANNALYNIHLLVGRIGTPGNGALCLDTQPVARGAANSVLPMFRALDSGAVRFLWVQGADPLMNLPNLRRYRAAAAKDDRFLVVSDAFPTPTSDAADVVLPAALWFETEGEVVSGEGAVQEFAQLLQPPGDARGLRAQTAEVARRAGHAQLRAQRTSAHALHTPRRYHTAHDAAAARSNGDYDFYGHADHRARIWLRPFETVAETPTREYPCWLEVGAVLEHARTGAFTRRIPTLHRAVPAAWAELNGEDARQLGIRNGDRVRLVSRRGSLTLEARVEQRSQPPRGHVFVPAFDEAHPVNVLMPDTACPLSGQPANGYCAVRVERVGGAAAS